VLVFAALLPASLLAADEKTKAPQKAPAKGVPEKDYAPFPNPDAGYVTDLAGLLTDKQEEEIERLLWRVESKTKVEIIVMIIDSLKDYPDAPSNSIDAFATGLFNAYGIGNMPKNDGVLLLVARKDRELRIELGEGYDAARDRDAKAIVDDVIVPRFKKDDYAGGITEGVRAIMREFARVRMGTNWTLIGMIVAVPVLGAVAYSLFRSGKRGWGWVVVGLIVVLVLAIIRTLLTVSRHLPRGSSSGWSSGGLGGFGGGSSSGGGASGSW
jgi:uncharacterized protein